MICSGCSTSPAPAGRDNRCLTARCQRREDGTAYKSKSKIPHSFPMAHTDMLYQSITYRIEPEKADELIRHDGSVILERTKGEIAARCDKEEANFLAINLAHEIATGKRSVDDARSFYAESIQTMMKTGKPERVSPGLPVHATDGRSRRSRQTVRPG
jgi:hypothetical protein